MCERDERRARACAHMHACTKSIPRPSVSAFPRTSHVARRRRRGTRGGLIRLDLVRHATCNVSLERLTRNHAARPRVRRTATDRTVEIVENCDLHARHTPVSADDSSSNIREKKEKERLKEGGLISKHFPDMRAHIMSMTNGMCINTSPQTIS